MYSREELWEIEARALREADSVENPSWQRVLLDLAHAATVVDAFIGRSSETKTGPPESPGPTDQEIVYDSAAFAEEKGGENSEN